MHSSSKDVILGNRKTSPSDHHLPLQPLTLRGPENLSINISGQQLQQIHIRRLLHPRLRQQWERGEGKISGPEDQVLSSKTIP